MPFAQRMCSFPLVLRYFVFFHNSEAYYQMGLLNVLHVSKMMLTAGSIAPSSGTPVAISVSGEKDFSLFVNCSIFSACDLPQQGWHTRCEKLPSHPLICAYIKGYHSDNTPLVTLASICNRGDNSEQSDVHIVPSLSLLPDWKCRQQLAFPISFLYIDWNCLVPMSFSPQWPHTFLT